MKKLIVSEFISLDGVIEGPGPADDLARSGWTTPYFSEQIGRFLGESGAQSDALLLGRVTYQSSEQFFTGQGADNPAAARMNGTNKYVVSPTPRSADWAIWVCSNLKPRVIIAANLHSVSGNGL
jgi:dihydrofolate reductase